MISQSKFDKVTIMTNNEIPWAERWPKPEFDQQGWEEAMSELSNMADEIMQNTSKPNK